MRPIPFRPVSDKKNYDKKLLDQQSIEIESFYYNKDNKIDKNAKLKKQYCENLNQTILSPKKLSEQNIKLIR